MGSITESVKSDKRTGKKITQFRAYIRRVVGGKSVGSSKVCATRNEAKEWIRNNEADTVLVAAARNRSRSFSAIAKLFVAAPPMRGTKYWKPSQLDFWIAELGMMRITEISRGDINFALEKLQGAEANRHTPAGIVPLGRKLSAGTINRYLATLSSVFNYALNYHRLDPGGRAGLQTVALVPG